MDHDAPEPEILNLEETATIACVQMRLMARAAGWASSAARELGDLMRAAVPMDDWDDECIAEVADGC